MNKSILELHGKYFKALDEKLIELHNESQKRGRPISNYYSGLLPMFYRDKTPQNGQILITGINPSFSNSFYKSIDNAIFSYDSFLKQSLVEQEATIEKLIGIQDSLIHGSEFNENELKQIDYFNKIECFLNKVGYSGNWDHCDVFPVRCTSQQIFLKALNQIKEYKSKLIDLYIDHLKVNKYKLVFVFNSKASLFIRNNLDLMPVKVDIFSRNKTYGFYQCEHLPGTMFFLFKMLSGQNPPLKEEKETLIEVVSAYLQNGK